MKIYSDVAGTLIEQGKQWASFVLSDDPRIELKKPKKVKNRRSP